jgi:hypothetical protein
MSIFLNPWEAGIRNIDWLEWINRVGLALFLVFICASCAQDNFKNNSIKCGKILQDAKALLEVSGAENISEKGKINSTVIKFDNTTATKYLDSKTLELNECYKYIVDHLNEESSNYGDALFMLAFINEMSYWLSGRTIEDRCKYIRVIMKKGRPRISNWLMDEVFGPFINSDYTLKDWLRMDDNSKYDSIWAFLMVPGEKGKKCD